MTSTVEELEYQLSVADKVVIKDMEEYERQAQDALVSVKLTLNRMLDEARGLAERQKDQDERERLQREQQERLDAQQAEIDEQAEKQRLERLRLETEAREADERKQAEGLARAATEKKDREEREAKIKEVADKKRIDDEAKEEERRQEVERTAEAERLKKIQPQVKRVMAYAGALEDIIDHLEIPDVKDAKLKLKLKGLTNSLDNAIRAFKESLQS